MKDQKFQKLASNKIRLSVNFENPTFFDKIAIFFVFILTKFTPENVHN